MIVETVVERNDLDEPESNDFISMTGECYEFYRTALTFGVKPNWFSKTYLNPCELREYVIKLLLKWVNKISYLFITEELNERGFPHCHVLLCHVFPLNMSRLRREYKYSNYIYAENVIDERHYLNYINKYSNDTKVEFGQPGTIPIFLGRFIQQF